MKDKKDKKATKDYSLYKYYKGSEKYPNQKAKFFGFYESMFERSYDGAPEDKEEAFKEYMSDLLYQKASDIYHFGYPGVDVSAKLEEFNKYYFDPDYKA